MNYAKFTTLVLFLTCYTGALCATACTYDFNDAINSADQQRGKDYTFCQGSSLPFFCRMEADVKYEYAYDKALADYGRCIAIK